MGFKINSIDQKQHINLSFYTWSIIENDLMNFYVDSEKKSLSGLLNRIFTNFYQESAATISTQLEFLLDKVHTIFDKRQYTKLDSSLKDTFIRDMLTNAKSDIFKKIETYEKNVAKKFRLNNENVEVLESSSEAKFYNDSIALYLKAIYEDYSRRPYHERERIFFKNTFLVIEDAIEKKCRLKVKLNNSKQFYILPYKVLIDKTGSFNYLAGYSKNIKEKYDSSLKITSFRISRIENIKLLRSKIAHLTQTKVLEIEKEIALKGVQFLAADNKEIKVKLSPIGVINYNSQLNQRPNLIRVENDNIYVFNCSELQALYYFFKFGKEALIMSPRTLMSKFKLGYIQALERYQ